MDEMVVKDRLALLLDHFGKVGDPREAAKVKYPLHEILFLVTCATIASCEDYEEITLWGEENIDFLHEYSEYYFGIPNEDWLRVVLGRIDPALFEACFRSWAEGLRPHGAALIALDGKTLRRSHDAAKGQKALHLVSAWASTQRLVLSQEAVDSKENECAAILEILQRLKLKGATITIDAIATNPAVAEAIINAGADYVLALKRNQPTLHDEVARYFADPGADTLDRCVSVEKDHGRLETRTTLVSHTVDWLKTERRYPNEPRFPHINSIICSMTVVEEQGKQRIQTRYFIASAAVSAESAARAIRSHWSIESMHWVLDVIFKEDQSRLRASHGAHNMALVRRLAFALVRQGKGKRSIKTTRKAASWNPATLRSILQGDAR